MNDRETDIYNDEYETCNRTSVNLLVYTGEESADMVNSLTGVTATIIRKKGEVIELSSGRSRVTPLNAWFLLSEDNVDSKDMRRHLDWMIEKINSFNIKLNELKSNGYEVRLECIWWSKYNTGGPTVYSRQLSIIGDFGLDLEFEFAYYGDEDNDNVSV